MKELFNVLLNVLSALEQNKCSSHNEHNGSSNTNPVIIITQKIMKELLTELVQNYPNIDTNIVSEFLDLIHSIGTSNTDTEFVGKSVAGVSSAANLALYGVGPEVSVGLSGVGSPNGVYVGGVNPSALGARAGVTAQNTTSYAGTELNESLQETNILLRRIFFKNYDCESEYSKQIALISLFTGIKNVIEYYNDYIKENPNPLISKYLDKMADLLPSIDPSDSKNKLSKHQFIAIVAILMIINYMLCYTNNLTVWAEAH